jgi:uncharacterized protein YukE
MSDTIKYSPAEMREVASKIITDASSAIDDHESSWQRMDTHLQSYPWFLQELLRNIIEPHQQRLRNSYNWQIAFARALSAGADAMEQTDQAVAQEFEL